MELQINTGTALDILRHASPVDPTQNLLRRSSFRAVPLVPEHRRHRPEIYRSLHAVRPELREYLSKLMTGSAPWPLLLHGPTGTGKSCAALALTDIAESSSVWEAEALARLVLNQEPHEVEAEFMHIAKYELAVLDELGTRDKVGDLAYSVVKRFIDCREAKNRCAIYISNIDPDVLRAIYDDRIYSRLTCGTVIKLDGDDRRREYA